MSNEPKLLDYVSFREYRDGDYNFLLSNWAKSYRGSPYSGPIPNNRYHETMKELVDQLLERGAYVVLAVSQDNDDQFLGFVCWEQAAAAAVVHYVFVKDEFREIHGLGRILLSVATKGQPFVYTHKTLDEGAKRLQKGGTFVKAIACRKNLEPVCLPKKKTPSQK